MQIEKPFPKEEKLFPTKKEVLLTKLYKMQKYNEDSYFEEIKSLGYTLNTTRVFMYNIRKITETEKNPSVVEQMIKNIGKPTTDIIIKLYDKHTAIWTPPENKAARKFKSRKKQKPNAVEPNAVEPNAVEPNAVEPKTKYLVISNTKTTILPNKDTAMGFIAALENINGETNIKLFALTNIKEINWQSQRLENGSFPS